jgi:serine/threonine-protein kinase HipA
VLIGNGDAHLKNWAFVYPDGRRPALSPVYDVLPTVLYIPDDDLGLNLHRHKDFDLVTSASFEALGARSGYGAQPAKDRAKSAAARVLDRWDLLKDYLTDESYARLTARAQALKLSRE